MKWTKFKARKINEESQYDFIYEGKTPDVFEMILVSDGNWVDFDTWVDFEDGTVGLENYYYKDPNELYWMSLPKPPHVSKEDK